MLFDIGGIHDFRWLQGCVVLFLFELYGSMGSEQTLLRNQYKNIKEKLPLKAVKPTHRSSFSFGGNRMDSGKGASCWKE
jgi:hypothetical protein